MEVFLEGFFPFGFVVVCGGEVAGEVCELAVWVCGSCLGHAGGAVTGLLWLSFSLLLLKSAAAAEVEVG